MYLSFGKGNACGSNMREQSWRTHYLICFMKRLTFLAICPNHETSLDHLSSCSEICPHLGYQASHLEFVTAWVRTVVKSSKGHPSQSRLCKFCSSSACCALKEKNFKYRSVIQWKSLLVSKSFGSYSIAMAGSHGVNVLELATLSNCNCILVDQFKFRCFLHCFHQFQCNHPVKLMQCRSEAASTPYLTLSGRVSCHGLTTDTLPKWPKWMGLWTVADPLCGNQVI